MHLNWGMDFQQLNAPLMQPASPRHGSDGNFDDRYDALGSTMRSSLSSQSLVSAYLGAAGGSSPTRDASSVTSSQCSKSEADAAGGGLKSSSIMQPSASKLSSFTLAVILFFNAAGGPFGTEPSLKAAGNLYAIIGFAVMPFLWALPEAVMTYELSAMYPCASGGVRWTEEAFGNTWGLLVGYLGWISGVTNNASYPVLFLSYVHDQFFPQLTDSDWYLHYGILVAVTLLLAFVNYRGLGVVGKTAIVIFFVSMAPFVVMVIMGIPKIDPSKWLQTPTGEIESFDDDALGQQGWFPNAYVAGIAFRPFINNLYWNFNGLDQGSHYSNVVTKQTLRNGLGGAFLFTSTAYLLPILVATGATDIQRDEWKEGSFATAGTEIGGRWLGNWVVVSSGISLLAQFFSEMAADSMQIQGMADRGQLPKMLSHRSPHDTPTYCLLLGVLLILVLLPLPFGIIIELSNFAFCLSVSVEFLAFAQLRIRKGDCTKLRKILYGVMLVAPMLFNITVLLLASYATYIYGACLTVFGLLLINAKRIGSVFRACCSGGCDIASVRHSASTEEDINAGP